MADLSALCVVCARACVRVCVCACVCMCVQGYLPSHLHVDALKRLSRQCGGLGEELMKALESLDAMVSEPIWCSSPLATIFLFLSLFLSPLSSLSLSLCFF